ncbi:MAG: TlpA family protein disulfide reductase [Ilumatobacteraceae bacterium]|nr:TlpA family protein disulfide reductase [Ilumatobacteraceae bacterium]
MSDGPSRARVAPLVALVVALVLGGLFWILAASKSGTEDKVGLVDSPLIDRPAPSVRSSTIDDVPFDLARRKGSWVVVNFFNSRCVPCIAEHADLMLFVEQQATFADGAEFYSFVQPPDSDDDIRAFFAERGGDWPVIRDDDGRLNVAFGVAQVPETFIIDPSGVVRVRWAGQIDAVTLSQLVQQQRALYEGS